MKLFDTHAHYDDKAFDNDRATIVAGLPEHEAALALCPGCDMKSSQNCVRLAMEYDHIYAAVGVHPHDAQNVPAGWLSGLEVLSHNPKVKAIGEIGLDYHYDFSPRDEQQDVFRAQMDLAGRLDLPVIIHDREAHRDCLDVVKAYPNVTGVYHCYSGGIEDAKTLVNLGWMLSFTGAITFKNAKKALEVISWLPLEHMMIETDSPYLTPEPHRGKRNDSTYVHYVAEKIAEVKGLPVAEIAAITMENGKRFFGIE
jgi:TatD DNase family protein